MILSSHLASLALALLALLTVATSPVSAVKCGDTISQNTVLTADLTCPCSLREDDHALFVEGPATLDLNGHTVSCTNSKGWAAACIAISGKGVIIKNGIVKGCDWGVLIIDESQGALIKDMIALDNAIHSIAIYSGNNHRVLNVAVTAPAGDTTSYGITLYGNNNQVKDCYLLRSGIELSGKNNAVISNIVEDIENDCIRSSGGGSVIKNNTLRRCGWYGVEVAASNSSIVGNKFYSTRAASIKASFSARDKYFTRTRIAGNQIYKSGGDGIQLWAVRNVVVDSNVIVDSAANGILLPSSTARCTVTNNTIRNCGTTGLRIKGADDNNFADNKISFCGNTGISAGLGSNRNRFINNRASNNALIDLKDWSANCGSNIWKGNTGKGNIACTLKT